MSDTTTRHATRHATRLPLVTAAGDFIAAYTAAGLAGLEFPPPSAAPGAPAASAVPAVPAVPPALRHWHDLTTRAVLRALAGQAPAQLPPLDLSQGTVFQQQVWRALQSIATSQTRTYGAIAATLGRPTASRAVGRACAANPIPLLIPCHRVLAAAGGLGGFSGGLEWKRRLLAAEGMRVPAHTPQ